MNNKQNELFRILKIALRISYAVMRGFNGCGTNDVDFTYDAYSCLN